jgi:hypothetical protein
MTDTRTRIEKRRRARAVACAASWGAVLCLAVTGCGGDSGATRTSAADDDPCDALSRFDNTFESTVTAVKSGDTNAIHASVAGLKQEYLAVQQALETQAPEQHEQVTTTMTKLSNAVARLPRDASPERVKAGVSKQVTGVQDAVDDAMKTLECPSS